ncbi:hypothetical protein AB0C06_12065 [Micromonospora inaquosa]|uniref:hypothetical protein n=1 Tax=Micromonospora inaquosa TaxID=2203716 RepID=UPI0013151F9C|nr:hypothetical protein [Micromonospora inaquosa]
MLSFFSGRRGGQTEHIGRGCRDAADREDLVDQGQHQAATRSAPLLRRCEIVRQHHAP